MVVIEVDKGCLQSSTLQFTEVVLQDTVQNIFVSRDFQQCWECAVLSSLFVPSPDEGALKLHRVMRGCSAALGACCVH